MKKLTILLCFIFSTPTLGYILRINKWDKYYASKIYQPPQELIVKVSHYFQNPGFAIDLGCGTGNEAVYLVANGWKVLAIDRETSATDIVSTRKDIDSPEKLITLTASFDQDLSWDDLPSADLIYASNALPFCHSQKFTHVWTHIKRKIKPGGRFAGHFFGPHYYGFSEKDRNLMTFLTLQEVNALFEGFTIEYIDETEEDGVSGTGSPIHSHIFEIIAKRK